MSLTCSWTILLTMKYFFCNSLEKGYEGTFIYILEDKKHLNCVILEQMGMFLSVCSSHFIRHPISFEKASLMQPWSFQRLWSFSPIMIMRVSCNIMVNVPIQYKGNILVSNAEQITNYYNFLMNVCWLLKIIDEVKELKIQTTSEAVANLSVATFVRNIYVVAFNHC